MRSDSVDIGSVMASQIGKLQGDNPDSLIKEAMRGNSDAFGIIYLRYLDAIYRYVYFRVGDEAEAEDLTEEVFIRAWEALPSYRLGEHPFTSWLYRIARNLAIDYHRKRKTQALPDLEIHFAATTPSNEDRLVQNQDMAQLADAIQMLDEEEQQVVLLRFVEGCRIEKSPPF